MSSVWFGSKNAVRFGYYSYLLVTFYLNGGLHAVSIGKPCERMSNFYTVRFF